MKHRTNKYIIPPLLLLLFACNQQIEHHGRTPLVEVEGNILYKEDVENALPLNVSKDDSLLFAEEYTKNWIEDILLLKNAERNISNKGYIEQLVENYRHSLILHTYQQNLISQKFTDEITENDIENFYQENKDLFLLEKPLVKGIFIKIPLSSPNVNNVRQWYLNKEEKVIEKLEKYSLQYAIDYDYFYDHWISLEDIVTKMPISASNPMSYVINKRQIELKDTVFHYFLNVEEVLEAGKHKPLNFARSEIIGVLQNIKQVNFMKDIRTDLYQQALEKGHIKYHY